MDGAHERDISSRMSVFHIANITTMGTKGRSIMYKGTSAME